jgi:peroxiredoxin
VVLVFYRGEWCPFCTKSLANLQDSLATIVSKNATVIAITPEAEVGVAKTVSKTKASFHVISDQNLAILTAYEVGFALDDATQKKYLGYGIDLGKVNGSNGANLPVPATYVIGQDGKVAFVHFDPDYRKRPSVAAIAAAIPVK